jgi:hypothetical protein
MGLHKCQAMLRQFIEIGGTDLIIPQGMDGMMSLIVAIDDQYILRPLTGLLGLHSAVHP